MTPRPSSQDFRPSRRSLLAMVGAASVAGPGLLAACSSGRDTGSGPPQPGSIPDMEPGGSFHRLVSDLAAKDQFAGNVLVAHRGEPVLTASYGMADKEEEIPHGPDTIYNIGSLTKLVTAVAIVQLVAGRKVGLGETVGTYLPGFPTAVADTVTVHDLLTHSGGLGNFRASPEWKNGDRAWTTPEEAYEGTMAIIRQEQLLYPPGTDSKYSNSGFYVLGAIVAQASGQSYWDYVREHVFGPAGMTRSDFNTNQDVQTRDDFAKPYGDPGPDGQRPDLLRGVAGIGIGGGAGGSYSSTGDLLDFALALQRHELLGPVYTDIVLSGKKPSGRGATGMAAYGSSLAIVNDHARLGHIGGAEGITAALHMYLDLDWVVILASNYTIKEGLRPLIEQPDRTITRQT